MVRSAVNRIRDIANDLLEQNRALNKIAASNHLEDKQIRKNSSQFLPSLLEELMSEKRMQFRQKIGIEIDSRLDTSSYGLFAEIQPIEFKRILSNLVNNSVEAIYDKGIITIRLEAVAGNLIQVQVQDNGKGIPSDILAKLGQRGETYGKGDGLGLGLYHARTLIESWAGKLKLESEIGHGTTITMIPPESMPLAGL